MKNGALIVVCFVLLAGLSIYIFNSSLTGFASAGCTDSDQVDGLSNIFRSGVTRKGLVSYHDTCVGNSLVEAYCDSAGKQRKASIKCDYGCSLGKCNKMYCKDSDGKSVRSAGITSGFYDKDHDLLGISPVIQSKNYTDWCYSENEVAEYYCVGGYVKNEIMGCSSRVGKGSVCVAGKCVSNNI